MLLPLSSPHAARLEALAECASTNTVLVGHAAEGWPDFAVVVTDTQTAGRGRLGRVWTAPPGQTLAVSVLLRSGLPLERLGWLPLLGGLAMSRAVRSLLAERTSGDEESTPAVGLKWPNDVLVDERKVSGLLTELVPDGSVVLGAGLNLSIAREELPTEMATSLTLHGVSPEALFDRALAAYLAELRGIYDAFCRHGGDADASGLRAQLVTECATIGRSVRLQLPGGATVVGRALDLDPAGHLVVERADDGAVMTVTAGDVTHLRYA